MTAQALEQSVLESKDKTQLIEIAKALGVKATPAEEGRHHRPDPRTKTGGGAAASASGTSSERSTPNGERQTPRARLAAVRRHGAAGKESDESPARSRHGRGTGATRRDIRRLRGRSCSGPTASRSPTGRSSSRARRRCRAGDVLAASPTTLRRRDDRKSAPSRTRPTRSPAHQREQRPTTQSATSGQSPATRRRSRTADATTGRAIDCNRRPADRRQPQRQSAGRQQPATTTRTATTTARDGNKRRRRRRKGRGGQEGPQGEDRRAARGRRRRRHREQRAGQGRRATSTCATRATASSGSTTTWRARATRTSRSSSPASTACARATTSSACRVRPAATRRTRRCSRSTRSTARPRARPRSVPASRDLTALFPDSQLRLEDPSDPTNMTARIIDLVSPIGKGQRGIIVSPPKAGKTTIMKTIATSIEKNNPEVKLIVLLIDERPEEVTDMQADGQGRGHRLDVRPAERRAHRRSPR